MIGIDDNRLSHIHNVANRCYDIAKHRGHEEEFCKKMWLIGWLHDIGYEFAEHKWEHPEISSAIKNMYAKKKITSASVPILIHQYIVAMK